MVTMGASVDLKGVVKHLVDGTLHRNLCRICLLPFGKACENISTKICRDDLEYNVADILETLCQVKFTDTDDYNVCSACFKMAIDAYKFYTLAKRTDEILNYYIEELESNVYSIETMSELHDSLCITLPEYTPSIKPIDFNVKKFLENPFVHQESLQEKVERKPKLITQTIKLEPESAKGKKDDEDLIIVISENGKSSYFKVNPDGLMIQSKEVPNSTERPKRKHRKKREPMISRSCSRCPVKYSFLAKLQMHMKIEHNVDLYVCKICKAMYEDENEYNIHQGTHSDIHQCNYCALTFKKRDAIIAHLKMHEDVSSLNGDTNICELCGTILSNEEQLIDHYEKKHIKKYTCYYCGKMYKGELSFEMHIKKHEQHMKTEKKQPSQSKKATPTPKEDTNKKRCACAVCGRDFVDQRALLWHSMLHTDQRPYSCHVCGRGFVSVNRRNQHVMCAHSRPTKRCPLCPALFHLRSMVNTHIKKVHLKAHKRRNRASKHQNVCWKTEAVPIQELSISIQNEILELQTRRDGDNLVDNPSTSQVEINQDFIPIEWVGR